MRLASLLAAVLILLPAVALTAQAPTQTPEAAPSLASRLSTVLQREAGGHSPTPEEIAGFDPLDPLPTPSALNEALPLILKALQNPDTAVRQLALTALGGLQTAAPLPAQTSPAIASTPSSEPATTPVPPIPASPPNYKPDLARILSPAVPAIAAHLTDDSPPIRLQTAIVLGGFTSDPPPAIYPPLFAYLKRDDAISTVGQMVVSDLLQLGPISDTTADAISRFLRRSDQTASSRSDLVDAIASKLNQSQSLNKTLLTYLSSDDPSLRARVILSLPQLDLAPDVFADTKAAIAQIAAFDPAGGQENLQVITAAKSISTCWTATRMTTGCPAY